MIISSQYKLALSGLLVAAVVVFADRAIASDSYETPPTFKASDILPPALLSGPHHRVNDEVVNDGYINRYTIESKFGSFDGVTSAKLRKRIREVNALAVMEEVRGTKLTVTKFEQTIRQTCPSGSSKHP